MLSLKDTREVCSLLRNRWQRVSKPIDASKRKEVSLLAEGSVIKASETEKLLGSRGTASSRSGIESTSSRSQGVPD